MEVFFSCCVLLYTSSWCLVLNNVTVRPTIISQAWVLFTCPSLCISVYMPTSVFASLSSYIMPLLVCSLCVFCRGPIVFGVDLFLLSDPWVRLCCVKHVSFAKLQNLIYINISKMGFVSCATMVSQFNLSAKELIY